MKVLLVDDEKHVRDVIRMLVDWTRFEIDVILEAEDALEAMDVIVNEQPQIIIVDMVMPGKDGVELMRWVQQQALNSKIIVVSGHSDFEFVRHTVRYGAIDYILKPIISEQLNDAIGKAVQNLKHDEQERLLTQKLTSEIKQLKHLQVEKLLSDLIKEGDDVNAAYEKVCQELPNLVNTKKCRIALLNLDSIHYSLRDRIDSNSNMIIAILGICNQTIASFHCGIAFKYVHSDNEIVLFFWGRLQDAETLIKKINDEIFKRAGSFFDFGISLEKPFPSGTNEAFHDAGKVFRSRNVFEPSKRIYVYAPLTSKEPASLHFNNYTEDICIAVLSGKRARIIAVINQWFKSMSELNKLTFGQIKLWNDDFAMLRTRLAHELQNNEEQSLLKIMQNYIVPFDNEGKLSIMLWKQEIIQCLTQYLDIFQYNATRNSNIIYSIARYIEQNFNRDLTLNEIADHFCLSREYISRKFKQCFNKNLIDYLRDIRIERAKVLLENPLLKIYEVAQMVGYQDEKYFSKVFKSVEQISPYDYRKNTVETNQ